MRLNQLSTDTSNSNDSTKIIIDKLFNITIILFSAITALYYLYQIRRYRMLTSSASVLVILIVLVSCVGIIKAGDGCHCTVYVSEKIYCSNGCYLKDPNDVCCTERSDNCTACWAFWWFLNGESCPEDCFQASDTAESGSTGSNTTTAGVVSTATGRQETTTASSQSDKTPQATTKSNVSTMPTTTTTAKPKGLVTTVLDDVKRIGRSADYHKATKTSGLVFGRRLQRAASPDSNLIETEENKATDKVLKPCSQFKGKSYSNLVKIYDSSMLRLYLATISNSNPDKVIHCVIYDDVCGVNSDLNGTYIMDQLEKPLYVDERLCKEIKSQKDPYFINIDSPNMHRICVVKDTEGMVDLPVMHVDGYTIEISNACKMSPKETAQCETNVVMRGGTICVAARADGLRTSYFQLNYHSFTDNIKFNGFLERCLAISEVNNKVIHGSCNSNAFRYAIALSQDDVCFSQFAGRWEKPSRAYCLYPKTYTSGLILLIIYACFWSMGTLITIFVSMCYFYGKKFAAVNVFSCAVCGVKLPPGMKKNHACNNVCYKCGKPFRSTELAMQHARSCIGDGKAEYMALYEKSGKVYAIFLSVLKFCVLVVVINMMVKLVNSEDVDDPTACKTVPDITQMGAVRYSIESQEKDKHCSPDESCTSTIITTGTMRAHAKTVQSWTVAPKGDMDGYTVTIGIEKVQEKCSLLPQYLVCDNIIKVDHAHSCMGNDRLWERMSGAYWGRSLRYEVVRGRACKITRKVKELWKPYGAYIDTAADTYCDTCKVVTSWEGWACWNVRTDTPCEAVVKKNGCQYILSVITLIGGICKRKVVSIGKTIGDFKVQMLTNPAASEGEVVLKTNQGTLKRGPINDLGEYSSKYGSIQWADCPGLIKPNTTGEVRCEDGSTFEARVVAGEDILCPNSRDPRVTHRKEFDCEASKVKFSQCMLASSVSKDHLYDAGKVDMEGYSIEDVTKDIGAIQFQHEMHDVQTVKKRSKRETSGIDLMAITGLSCLCTGYENRVASSKCVIQLEVTKPMSAILECYSSEIYIPNGVIILTPGVGEYLIDADVGYSKVANCSLSGAPVNCVVETSTYVPAFISHDGVESLPNNVNESGFFSSIAAFFVGIWRSAYSFFSSIGNSISFIILAVIIIILIVLYKWLAGPSLPGNITPKSLYNSIKNNEEFVITSSGARIRTVGRRGDVDV